MSLFAEILISLLIVTGAAFALVGSWGLIRLPELMSRLHAPTKATTLGVGGALAASMAYFLAAEGRFSVHELLISLFLFLTAPITAHFLAKAHLHRQVRELEREVPPAAGGGDWATFEEPPAESPPVQVRDRGPSKAGERPKERSDALA